MTQKINQTIKDYNQAIKLDIDKLLEKFGVKDKGYDFIEIKGGDGYGIHINIVLKFCINRDIGLKYLSLSDFLIATIDDVVREIYDIRDEIDLGKYKTFLPNSFGVYQFDDNDDDKKMVKEEIKDKLMDVLETQNLEHIQQYMLDLINLIKK